MPREAEKIDFEIIHHLPNQLGECSVWDDRENLLYWVDIKARQILRHDPSSEKTDSVDVPGRPGMLALCEDGGLVIAQERGLQRFSFEEGLQEFLVQVENMRRGLLGNLRPKMLKGSAVTGAGLVALLRSYVAAINEGAVPSVEHAWANALRKECESALSAAEAVLTSETVATALEAAGARPPAAASVVATV